MLVKRINEDIINSLKAGDSDELSTLRLLKSALKNQEISKQRSLSFEEEIVVLLKQAK